jgi:hypothetical protein
MLPFIRAGDYVTVKMYLAQEAQIGDIVVYATDRKNIIACHRLVKIENNSLIVKGDNRLGGYERIQNTQLLGRVICIEKGGNKLSMETEFQGFFAKIISWFSFHCSVVIVIFVYLVEICREPHFVLFKIIKKLRKWHKKDGIINFIMTYRWKLWSR